MRATCDQSGIIAAEIPVCYYSEYPIHTCHIGAFRNTLLRADCVYIRKENYSSPFGTDLRLLDFVRVREFFGEIICGSIGGHLERIFLLFCLILEIYIE